MYSRESNCRAVFIKMTTVRLNNPQSTVQAPRSNSDWLRLVLLTDIAFIAECLLSTGTAVGPSSTTSPSAIRICSGRDNYVNSRGDGLAANQLPLELLIASGFVGSGRYSK